MVTLLGSLVVKTLLFLSDSITF